MNQRGPRLGGIVDDYCPRERRVTDHAVVAMVEDEIKQTRCTTCDEEHPYKQAKVPVTRKKKSTLFEQVLDARSDASGTPADSPSPAARRRSPARAIPSPAETIVEVDPVQPLATESAVVDDESTGSEDTGRVHRRLIRATLPRQEGQAQPRSMPEFTIRQSTGGHNGQYHDQEPRRAQRGGYGSQGTGDNGQPANRRAPRPKSRRPARQPDDRSQSFSGNADQRSGNAGERAGPRFKSRSRRPSAGQGKKRSK